MMTRPSRRRRTSTRRCWHRSALLLPLAATILAALLADSGVHAQAAPDQDDLSIEAAQEASQLDQFQAVTSPTGAPATPPNNAASPASSTQANGGSPLASGSSSTSLPTSTADATLVSASGTPYVLNNSISVRSTIKITNDTAAAPAFFQLPLLSDEVKQLPIYVAVSLCSGPNEGVVPNISANASSSTRKTLLESSLARVYVSLANSTSMPGPPPLDSGLDDDDTVGPTGALAYAWGGFAQLTLNRQGTDNPEAVWIGIWPPRWAWNAQEGEEMTVQVVVSTAVPTLTLENRYGVTLDDTDSTRALLTSFNYTVSSPDTGDTSVAPNISLVILPTLGQYSLPSTYYNSSFCALQDAWAAFSSSVSAPQINSSETTRGSTALFDVFNRRLQFEVAGLDSGTNYTAWLVSVNTTGRAMASDGTLVAVDPATGNATSNSTTINVPGVSLYPAVKMKTKSTPTCRLVYDVDFCPQVAYSIPVGPGVSTEDALNVINQTVTPNYGNFSKTISTFPCDDPYFGQYSSVRTCADCKRAYQDWLCAVTMPRCTDPLTDPGNQSAAVTDVDSLIGRTSPLNTRTLPYIVNRNVSHTRHGFPSSTQLGIDGTYGEVLPCLYTCLFVTRNCPGPLIQWACPSWDLTAQHDYGTFADSGKQGLGAALNGGAGDDLSRWGGPLRYVAQDNFGMTYCSALGVDQFLRETNGVGRIGGVGGRGGAVAVAVAVGLAVLLGALL